MTTLQEQQVLLQYKKLSTYREACIGWFKYINTSLSLQSSAKLHVKNMLKSAHDTRTEIASLTTTNHKPVTTKPLERSRKRIGEINHDADDEWKDIVFPTFDLNMRIISFSNGDKYISTIEFDIWFHPDNFVILKLSSLVSIPMIPPPPLTIILTLFHRD